MFIVICTVSACVHMYSIGYMKEDPSKIRFMGYLSLFTFFMLVLVSSNNLLQMFFGWEGVGLASYLLIGFWHHKASANNAAIKAFVVNRIGDFGFALGIAGVFFVFGSIDFDTIFNNAKNFKEHQIIFASIEFSTIDLLCFLLFVGAMGKSAQLGLHTWLPDAHVEAPTGGSVILAAVLLKMGGYGFLRFSLPIAPDASAYLANFMIALSLIAIIYIGLVAISQTDMKKLIAYSSISHMGFVTLGTFVFYNLGIQSASPETMSLAITGSMIQMISHGLISAALFLCVGVIYDRLHTRLISDYQGVVNSMPKFATLMVFFALANAAIPGTSGFVGEFTVIMASFKINLWIAFFTAITLIIGAVYSLWLIKRVIFGEPLNERISGMQEMTMIEALPLATLALLVLTLGLWPAPLVEIMSMSIENLVNHIAFSKL